MKQGDLIRSTSNAVPEGTVQNGSGEDRVSLTLETSQVTRSLKVGFSLSPQCELALVNDHANDR